MKTRINVIGNGFDLAHELPTKFDPHFKRIAIELGDEKFWELYQTEEDDIWSDFEHLLARPDFNSLEEIFNGYNPDYLSDRESDRDAIMLQAQLNGQLQTALDLFVDHAEKALKSVGPKDLFTSLFDKEDVFINFNYTHTLEEVYGIGADNILHIHGEAGVDNLLLGYPEGTFDPEPYSYDVRQKGVGPYIEKDIDEYISEIEDYYVRSAYESLYIKVQAFSKESRAPQLRKFLRKQIEEKNTQVESIIVYGHSCAIDYEYFEVLNQLYPEAKWEFYVKHETDQKDNVNRLTKRCFINDYKVISI